MIASDVAGAVVADRRIDSPARQCQEGVPRRVAANLDTFAAQHTAVRVDIDAGMAGIHFRRMRDGGQGTGIQADL